MNDETLEPGGDSGYVCEHGYSEPHGEDGVVEASYEAKDINELLV